ncbi:hypothetical protein [Salinigranum sp.]|uniref:hypothetical protein n=1 Tax=Salinigranum sp. TaxID=1966351 RepID=UPI003565C13D
MRFPELHGRDLDGRSVYLPTDVGSDPTLLLVRFAPQPSREAETWLPLVADVADAVPGFWCYDLLVLPEFPDGVEEALTEDLHAPLTDGGDVPGVRALTAHTDVDAFRRALVLDRPARIYALLLREGRVQWRAFGPLTVPLDRSLRAAVTPTSSGDANDLVVP